MRNQLNWKLPNARGLYIAYGSQTIRRPARLDAGEPRLGHADDLEACTVLQREPASDDRRIAAEPPHPERVAQDRHRVRARRCVVLRA